MPDRNRQQSGDAAQYQQGMVVLLEMSRWPPTHLGSNSGQSVIRQRMPVLLRHGSVQAQQPGLHFTCNSAVLAQREEPALVSRDCHCRQWPQSTLMCPICLHEWQCQIAPKVHWNTGCPHCAKTYSGQSKDGVRQKHPTFASCNHSLLFQWDHELNAREENYPDNTTLKSNKHIWWTCDQCPKGKKHNWSARANNRTRTPPAGCPFCSHRQPCDCNSLHTLYPELAADFDSKANGLTPDQVTGGSGVKYRWLSDKPGAPLRSVDRRSLSMQSKLQRARRRCSEDVKESSKKVG